MLLAAAEDVEAQEEDREGPELQAVGHDVERLHPLAGADLAVREDDLAQDGNERDEEGKDAEEGAVVDGDVVGRERRGEDGLGHEGHEGGADCRDEELAVAQEADGPKEREEHGADEADQEAVGQPVEELGGVLAVPVVQLVPEPGHLDDERVTGGAEDHLGHAARLAHLLHDVLRRRVLAALAGVGEDDEGAGEVLAGHAFDLQLGEGAVLQHLGRREHAPGREEQALAGMVLHAVAEDRQEAVGAARVQGGDVLADGLRLGLQVLERGVQLELVERIPLKEDRDINIVGTTRRDLVENVVHVLLDPLDVQVAVVVHRDDDGFLDSPQDLGEGLVEIHRPVQVHPGGLGVPDLPLHPVAHLLDQRADGDLLSQVHFYIVGKISPVVAVPVGLLLSAAGVKMKHGRAVRRFMQA